MDPKDQLVKLVSEQAATELLKNAPRWLAGFGGPLTYALHHVVSIVVNKTILGFGFKRVDREISQKERLLIKSMNQLNSYVADNENVNSEVVKKYNEQVLNDFRSLMSSK